MPEVLLLDTTLRDGSHAVEYQFDAGDTRRLAESIATSGIDILEVGHGDGLGGSSLHFGRGSTPDDELVAAAVDGVKAAGADARVAVLCVPGLATMRDVRSVRDAGASVVRVATHVTEADVSRVTIERVRDEGLTAFGFLMMIHMTDRDTLVDNARRMAEYGAEVIYLADSAGALLPEDYVTKVRAVREAVDVPIGVHTHNNLGLAIANALEAVEAGASYVDGTVLGLGAGAGNAQMEALAVTLARRGCRDPKAVGAVFRTADLAADTLVGLGSGVPVDAVRTAGAGLYSSFLLPARRAAAEFEVPMEDLLAELGSRFLVAGQEDMIVDAAAQLAKAGA